MVKSLYIVGRIFRSLCFCHSPGEEHSDPEGQCEASHFSHSKDIESFLISFSEDFPFPCAHSAYSLGPGAASCKAEFHRSILFIFQGVLKGTIFQQDISTRSHLSEWIMGTAILQVQHPVERDSW